MGETMGNKTMKRTLYKVLRKTGVRRENIKLEASFVEDLRFDDLDWTLFVYYYESMFKFQLEDREITSLSFVYDGLEIANKRINMSVN